MKKLFMESEMEMVLFGFDVITSSSDTESVDNLEGNIPFDPNI